jgi:hypothetical protein
MSALLSALLWATLPADILAAGVVLPSEPNLFLGLVFVLLLARFYKSGKWVDLGASLLFLLLCWVGGTGLGISCTLLLLFVLAIKSKFIGSQASRLTGWTRILISLLILLALFLAGFQFIGAKLVFSELNTLIHTEGSFLYVLLLVASLYGLSAQGKEQPMFAFMLLASSIAGFVLSAEASNLYSASFLFVFFALVIVVGLGLTSIFGENPKWLGAPVVFGLLYWTLFISGSHPLIPDYEHLNWLSPYVLSDLSELATGVTGLALVIISLKLQGKRKSNGLAIVMTLFVFSMVAPTWKLVSPHVEAKEAAEAGSAFLAAQQLDLPVFFIENEKLSLYQFVQGLDPQRKENTLDLRKAPEQISDGFVVVPESQKDLAMPGWWEMYASGLRFERDIFFRSLSSDTTANEMTLANHALETDPGPATYDRLYAVMQNANEDCKSYEAWMQGRRLGKQDTQYIPIQDLNCFVNALTQATPITLLEKVHDPPREIFQIQRLDEFESRSGVWRIFHEERTYQDPRTFTFEVEIKPDTFYLFSGWFKANEETMFLFWKLDGQEHFASRQRVPDWSQLGVLIYSGDEAQSISVSPALIDNYGFVYFYDLVFTEVTADQ